MMCPSNSTSTGKPHSAAQSASAKGSNWLKSTFVIVGCAAEVGPASVNAAIPARTITADRARLRRVLNISTCDSLHSFGRGCGGHLIEGSGGDLVGRLSLSDPRGADT